MHAPLARCDAGFAGQVFQVCRQRCNEPGIVDLTGRAPCHHDQVEAPQLFAIVSEHLAGQALHAIALYRAPNLFL